MKRKGITIWEQHLERFVLAAAALFLLVFGGWQFLRSPNAVDRGRERVQPNEVDRLLVARAEAIQSRLTPEAPPAMEIPEPAPILREFQGQLAASISPAEFLEPMNRAAVIGPGFPPPGGDKGVAYVEPRIPAPRRLAMVQGFDALAASVVEEFPDLKERFKAEPYDVTWMTVAALFDVEGVLKEYRREVPDEARAIPASWYADRVDVLDVRLEREEYVDGTWANATTIAPIHGQDTVRADLQGAVAKATRDRVLAHVSQDAVAPLIQRPPFYALERESFSPPDPRDPETEEVETGLSPEQRELRKLEGRRRKAVRDREQALEALKGLGGSVGAPTAPPEGAEDPGEGKRGGKAPPGAGGGIGRGEGDGRRGHGATQAAESAERIKRLQKNITRLDQQIASLGTQIEQLGGVVAVKAPSAPGPGAAEDGAIVVWAHDPTIERGKTYRYRLIVDVYNPFFAQKHYLLEVQHGLADPIALSSAPSEWSEPRRAVGDTQVFVTRAYPADKGQLRLGQAIVEVYRFSHARWWMETFPAEPGDRIGSIEQLRQPAKGQPQTIDYGTEWFLLDIVQDVDMDRARIERGQGASVVLQRLDDPSVTLVQDPQTVETSALRDRLKSQVQAAEAESTELALGGDG